MKVATWRPRSRGAADPHWPRSRLALLPAVVVAVLLSAAVLLSPAALRVRSGALLAIDPGVPSGNGGIRGSSKGARPGAGVSSGEAAPPAAHALAGDGGGVGGPSLAGLPLRADWKAEGRPAWCDALLAAPRPWAASPGTPQHLKTCPSRKPGGECKDGAPIQFFSQHHQDAYLYLHHFAALRRRGVYWDVAANEPIQISNTFFYDRCLGWHGVCVEANPRYLGPLVMERGCVVLPTCVSATREKVAFRLSGAVGGVASTVKTAAKVEDVTVTMTCVTGEDVAARTGVREVDLLSLDVEGHELFVLQGLGLGDGLRVNVIVAEVQPHTAAGKFLLSKGYTVHEVVRKDPRLQFQLDMRYDYIYIAAGVVWGSPQ
ncbi:hypothetical protein I4F81_010277 [Pyropia yezoensis]|uniref:Uncharacterized protein n=1 Tax=Pyropia yezoensis TaxID=2788 RepID=A0ACC3CDB8_PYRYE|nr:hypothetical protein I4F81_010277 [Neopyropia yezoensis]